MNSRRNFLKQGSLISAATMIAGCSRGQSSEKSDPQFKYCLNTSTIRGQDPGLNAYLEIASSAGYDGVELWVRDVRKYLDAGHSADDLRTLIEEKGLSVENAIGFAPWLVPGEDNKKKGFAQMQEEMQLMASIGCKRIAAAPGGLKPEHRPLDLFMAGERYAELIEIGKKAGIMPQLEFWGASPVVNHMAQVVMIAAAANHPEVGILPDIYHLFRGNSGFESLKMLSGNVIEIFHLNDFVDSIPRTEQQDKDRVYPGDGVSPMQDVLTTLAKMGGEKVLSVELFNETYWKEDPLKVAQTALQKMKNQVALVSI